MWKTDKYIHCSVLKGVSGCLQRWQVLPGVDGGIRRQDTKFIEVQWNETECVIELKSMEFIFFNSSLVLTVKNLSFFVLFFTAPHKQLKSSLPHP